MITSEGTVFIDYIDTRGQKKDAEFIVKFIEKALKEQTPAFLQGTECHCDGWSFQKGTHAP